MCGTSFFYTDSLCPQMCYLIVFDLCLFIQMKVTLEETEQKCAQFRGERDEFEANVKKAFMRGVCALNLEAMTVLKTV